MFFFRSIGAEQSQPSIADLDCSEKERTRKGRAERK